MVWAVLPAASPQCTHCADTADVWCGGVCVCLMCVLVLGTVWLPRAIHRSLSSRGIRLAAEK